MRRTKLAADEGCGSEPPLIIGVGNEFRDDDAAGILVAREIRRRCGKATVVEVSGEGTALMAAWSGHENVIIVDAVSSGKEPGTITTFNIGEEDLPRRLFHCSSHVFGIAEAVALAKRLHNLPARLILYGIEGKDFGVGIGLSTPVVRHIPDLIAMILKELFTGEPSSPHAIQPS
jgi:hydrogenase maturation protease